MQKYFIAHLVGGRAKTYHEALTRELTKRFHTVPLHERVEPHVTVKIPFETDEAGIADVERVLRSFIRNERAVPISFSGFGRFGFRTVYLDIEKNREAVSLVRRAITVLHENIPWMPRINHEGNKLHASVARFLSRRQFRRIWRELAHLHPRFESALDNVAILRKEGKTWIVHTLIPIRPQEDDAVTFPALDAQETVLQRA